MGRSLGLDLELLYFVQPLFRWSIALDSLFAALGVLDRGRTFGFGDRDLGVGDVRPDVGPALADLNGSGNGSVQSPALWPCRPQELHQTNNSKPGGGSITASSDTAPKAIPSGCALGSALPLPH